MQCFTGSVDPLRRCEHLTSNTSSFARAMSNWQQCQAPATYCAAARIDTNLLLEHATTVVVFLPCRIPLSLGNKVTSRLLARTARAVLAPGSGPNNANSKSSNTNSFAISSSDQSASSQTDLRDSPSAVALRTGDSNLTANPTALGGIPQQSPEDSMDEAEDPFIKDTEDLVNSMATSSPSWNGSNQAAATNGSTAYANGSQQAEASQPSRAVQVDSNGNGAPSRFSQSNGSGSNAIAGDGRLRKDGSIEMVTFNRGESRKEAQQTVASRSSSSR